MKTRFLEATIPIQDSPQICVRSRVDTPVSARTQQLAKAFDNAFWASLWKARQLCSSVCMGTRKQFAGACEHFRLLLFQMGVNAKTWYWSTSRHTLALLSRMSKSAGEQSSRAWKRIRAQQIARSHSKRLHVAETVSLGEKRFVAVLKVDGREFLIGGGATNISLLAQLDTKKPLKAAKSFDGILSEKMTVPKKQPAKRAKKQIAKSPVEKTGGQW
jgi:flagellar biogenesis protein FliO